MHLMDDDSETYTNAVDIWATGIITVLLLTGEHVFVDSKLLWRYIKRGVEPFERVAKTGKVGENGMAFVRALLTARPDDRPTSKQCLQHVWLRTVQAPVEQRGLSLIQSGFVEITSLDTPSLSDIV